MTKTADWIVQIRNAASDTPTARIVGYTSDGRGAESIAVGGTAASPMVYVAEATGLTRVRPSDTAPEARPRGASAPTADLSRHRDPVAPTAPSPTPGWRTTAPATTCTWARQAAAPRRPTSARPRPPLLGDGHRGARRRARRSRRWAAPSAASAPSAAWPSAPTGACSSRTIRGHRHAAGEPLGFGRLHAGRRAGRADRLGSVEPGRD